MHANQIAEFSDVTFIIQPGVELFDKTLMLLREKNGIQKVVAEAKGGSGSFLEMHSSVFQPATVRTFDMNAFSQHRY